MSSFKVISHRLPGQHIREYFQSSPHGQEDVHTIAIKQYVPVDLPQPVPANAVTVLAFHGNGFPKESYEPFFADLCRDLKGRDVWVRGIWIADSSNQGESGVLNEHVQGDQTNWFDHSRDVLHMVNHFRDEMPRPIIGLAHSYGCPQLVHLSTLHPRLLSTVILIEPIIFDTTQAPAGPSPALRTLFRRDIWPTREDAIKSLTKAFGNWDPRTLEAYLKHGLRSIPTAIYHNKDNKPAISSVPGDKPLPHPLPLSAVTLTTTKAQESWSFLTFNSYPDSHNISDQPSRDLNHLLRPDQHPQDEWNLLMVRPEPRLALMELETLRPTTLFVYGKKSIFAQVDLVNQKTQITGTKQGGNGGVKEGKVKTVMIDGADHLVPFEKLAIPVAVTACGEWLGEWFQQWTKDEEIMKKHLSRKEGRQSDEEGLRLSKEWVAQTKKPMGEFRPTAGKSKI